MIARNGDTFTSTISAFNSTKRITPTEVVLSIGSGASQMVKRVGLTLDAGEAKSVDISVTVPSSWRGIVPYMVELREGTKVLDSLSQSLHARPSSCRQSLPSDKCLYWDDFLTDTPEDH